MTTEETLSELVAVAREQLRWQRAVSIPPVRAALEVLLTTSAMREAYELCDGERTFREIATKVGVSIGALSGWSRRWRDSGVAYEGEAGRIVHLVSLASLGMSVEVDGGESRPSAGRQR